MIYRKLGSGTVAVLFALMLALYAACATDSAQAADTVNVYILTTGDIHEHSQYLPRIASYIKYMKQYHQNVIAFDCGDHLTDYAPTATYNGDLWKLKTRGNVMYRAMASMGYDACTIGNHDSCYGFVQLGALMNKWHIPSIGVNIEKSPVQLPLTAPSVANFHHVSVGVVGTIATSRWHLDQFLAREHADANAYTFGSVRSWPVTSTINALKPGVDILVLLTHETDEDDRESADYLRNVSVIAGGHSHTTIHEYRTTQHDYIVKSGFKGRYVSQLEIVWDWKNKAIVSSSRTLVDMETQPYEDHGVKALLKAPFVKKNDFDGDSKSDLAVYNPNSKVFSVLTASGAGSEWTIPCGENCVPVQGDFDGDGKSDPAVYDQASGTWTALLSGYDYVAVALALGGESCTPMPGDYDGDLSTDCAVYEAATGTMTIEPSDEGDRFTISIGGGPGYIPASGYYDEDGLADPVLYKKDDGSWDGLMSGCDYAHVAVKFGAGHELAPGYYDSDGKIDPAIYDASSGHLTSMLSGSNYSPIVLNIGGSGCTATPADYDGDTMEDPAVYREADGVWYVMLSGNGYGQSALTFGGPGWVPVR